MKRYTDDTEGGIHASEHGSRLTEREWHQREEQLSEELAKAHRLREMLVSIMGHDLRTPLSVILGYSGLIKKQSNDETVKRFIGKIESAAMNADEMIRDIKTYSKVKGGVFESDLEEIDLNAMLSDILRALDGKIEEHGITIDMMYQTDKRFPVLGNELLKNAFLHTIDNAIKYSPEHETVTLTLDDVGSDWVFGVSDHGDGIPDDEKDSVFERFMRKEKRGIKGSGIGLAITESVVDAHNGSVRIEDNPGGGCIFYITVPKA
ncbi:MAG: Methanogenesis regulatory histidine kinase FilI [Candidatus Methanogaster sp.]|nr:MAG: Methanogenesis regulatory histidine kinase FilI [ANME-2 cluster archaeon]